MEVEAYFSTLLNMPLATLYSVSVISHAVFLHIQVLQTGQQHEFECKYSCCPNFLCFYFTVVVAVFAISMDVVCQIC